MKASNNFNVGSCSCPRKRLRSTPRASEKALSQAKHKTSVQQWFLNAPNTSNVSFLVLYMQKQYETIEKRCDVSISVPGSESSVFNSISDTDQSKAQGAKQVTERIMSTTLSDLAATCRKL